MRKKEICGSAEGYQGGRRMENGWTLNGRRKNGDENCTRDLAGACRYEKIHKQTGWHEVLRRILSGRNLLDA